MCYSSAQGSVTPHAAQLPFHSPSAVDRKMTPYLFATRPHVLSRSHEPNRRPRHRRPEEQKRHNLTKTRKLYKPYNCTLSPKATTKINPKPENSRNNKETLYLKPLKTSNPEALKRQRPYTLNPKIFKTPSPNAQKPSNDQASMPRSHPALHHSTYQSRRAPRSPPPGFVFGVVVFGGGEGWVG